jgi:RimJ/RimL family protein N-acetyltransferase
MPTQGAWECSFPMSGLSPSLPLAISACYRLAGGRGLSTLGAPRATRRASLGPARRTTLGAQRGSIGLDSIMAVAVPGNVGSWRVMEKAGMRYERLADFYGLKGLKKYVADRDWWSAPLLT